MLRRLFASLTALNKVERILLLAIVINQFSLWPTLQFDAIGGFSLELAMLSGLLIAAAGIHLYRRKLASKLASAPAFFILYIWVGFGVLLGAIQSDSPARILAKGLYLLSVVVAAHVITVFVRNKKVSVDKLMRAWVTASLVLAPLFLLQYILVAAGFDIFSKDAYTVGVFDFPRLHGFSFEPLFLAHWLLAPLVYSLVKLRSSPLIPTVIASLLFLTLARGAIIALVLGLAGYVIVARLNPRNIFHVFKPVVCALGFCLLLVAGSAQFNGGGAWNGVGRYLDHLSLGVFNSEGASNVSDVQKETTSGPITIIDTNQLDTVGVVEASSETRLEAAKLGLEIFRDNPITGVGMFRFGEEANERQPSIYTDVGVVTNSQPIDVVAETGLIGVALLGMFAAPSYRKLFALSIPALILFVLSVQYLFFTNLFLLPFWFILGVMVSGNIKKEHRLV